MKGEHYWIENCDAKIFPRGPKWLAGYIKSKGLRAGLWIVPNAYPGAVQEHPDWYLRDKDGKLILDYNTPKPRAPRRNRPPATGPTPQS